MARYKPYSYDQGRFIPVRFEEQKGSSEGLKEKETLKKLREKVKKLKSWLEENEDKQGSSGKVKKSNLTDNESAKMPVLAG